MVFGGVARLVIKAGSSGNVEEAGPTPTRFPALTETGTRRGDLKATSSYLGGGHRGVFFLFFS